MRTESLERRTRSDHMDTLTLQIFKLFKKILKKEKNVKVRMKKTLKYFLKI